MSLTSTERKRAWRLRHPEASQTAERERAQARRDGYWGDSMLGVVRKPCQSSESYWRHENTWGRFIQRTFWPTCGPGTAKMSREERRIVINKRFSAKRAELLSGLRFSEPA
jgi:hypothetical protein